MVFPMHVAHNYSLCFIFSLNINHLVFIPYSHCSCADTVSPARIESTCSLIKQEGGIVVILILSLSQGPNFWRLFLPFLYLLFLMSLRQITWLTLQPQEMLFCKQNHVAYLQSFTIALLSPVTEFQIGSQ